MEKKETIAELDKLFQEVGTYRYSADYRELLVFARKFPKIAPFNAMLLHMQKPGSSMVATAGEWRIRFGRKPIPGARPLVILKPFGPVEFVYELNDTEGKELPQIIEQPFEAIGEVTRAMLGNFIDNLYLSGIRVNLQNYGTDFAGQVQRINETANFTNSKGTIQFKQYYCITVNENMDNASKLATIYHELGHIFCGHIPCPNQKYIPTRGYLPKEVEEFEAESVCWLLCERQGIKNPSAQYLSTYLKGNGQVPNISLTNVLKAAGEIEQIRKGVSRLRKELLVKEK